MGVSWGLLSVFELLSANKVIIRSSNFFSFSSVQFGDFLDLWGTKREKTHGMEKLGINWKLKVGTGL
jgi:hypothetical protein